MLKVWNCCNFNIVYYTHRFVFNKMNRNEIPFPSAVFMIAVALLLTVNFVDSSYVAIHGGFCMTYDSTLLGTQVKFEKCNVADPRHDSWEFAFMEGSSSSSSSPPYLICIINTRICGRIGDDGKAYLADMDETDFSQLWIPYSEDRFLNYVTGFYLCAQAMHNPTDDDDVPDYIEMQPCSDNVYQKMLFSDS